MKKDFHNYIYKELHRIKDTYKKYYPNMNAYYQNISEFTDISISTIRNFLTTDNSYSISNEFLTKLNSYIFYTDIKQKSVSLKGTSTNDLIGIIFIRLIEDLFSIILSDIQNLDTYKLFKKLVTISDSVNKSIKDITKYDFTEEILVNFLCGLYNDNDNYVKIKDRILSYINDMKISFCSYPYYYLFDDDMIVKLNKIRRKRDMYFPNEFLFNTEKYYVNAVNSIADKIFDGSI